MLYKKNDIIADDLPAMLTDCLKDVRFLAPNEY